MKKTLLALLVFLSVSSYAEELWKIRMSIKVPRVFDNMQSQGYRKYQTQTVTGVFEVVRGEYEPTIRFRSLVNKTHTVNGSCVTYNCETDSVHWHVVGSNKTGKFGGTSVDFKIFAEPSYSSSFVPTDDNSLDVTLAGKGNCWSVRPKDHSIRGYVAGRLGCGCTDYGHVSPTRIWESWYVQNPWAWSCGTVVDTAAVFGTFVARRLK